MPSFCGYPPPSHDYPHYWVILDPKSKEDKVKVTNLKNSLKFQIFEFWNNHYTRHTFWSCLIWCANIKWIRWVLLKIQSGHDSVHRRTDRQTDKVKPVNPPFNFVEAGGIMTKMLSPEQNSSFHVDHIPSTNIVVLVVIGVHINSTQKSAFFLSQFSRQGPIFLKLLGPSNHF